MPAPTRGLHRYLHPGGGLPGGEDYVSQVKNLLQDRYTYARYLIDEDYFRHLFPDA